ncbi:TVP38/TMEM64 family protein [Desulfonatronum sp. SC1]|uniref:TVP38/TMEM64 family protein n=1 Tax=Desulfonatronum sp. SC1 TaxID=2109626 RepID=UPI000D3174F9|nr:TVP38/TMEM64 family protein [Desulfonatronum sp. SC1]PTN37249.1 TVP38/TMEM64 family protein [Desulfonatronum sp. SC1]
MQSKSVQKIALVLALSALVGAFFLFDLGQYFSLDYIKDSQQRFQSLYTEKTVTVIAVYMGVYILVTSLSLPGAVIMTLVGGALFGLAVGTVVVSFASTIGATLACFVSRFVLQDWVQRRFGQRLVAVNQGIEREGAFYLFTLRLVPLFPFWMINLVMGLTRMKLRTFFWVSQVGMLPGTLVYVNAGRELGRIDSLGGILSPGLIFSFVLLGIFPLATKKIMVWYRLRQNKLYPDVPE